jgi:hypothetical protein
LLEVQKLLPLFDPADINAILTIKIQFDKAMPGDNFICNYFGSWKYSSFGFIDKSKHSVFVITPNYELIMHIIVKRGFLLIPIMS